MKSVTPVDWKIPLALLAMSAIPCAAGIGRLISLAGNNAFNGDSERFLASPAPVILHILSSALFSLLGALQFSTVLRQRNARWHKVSGRVVVASGVLSALSGIWMTLGYPIPVALQGDLLWSVRLLVATSMLMSLVFAVAAAMQRDMVRHRAWMIRSYALGQGAGMQVVILTPWMLLMGTPDPMQRDALMTLAWLVNLFIAEMLVRRQALVHVFARFT